MGGTEEELPELFGLAEASDFLGLSKQALRSRARTSGFPEPAWLLACGPVWTREQLVGYALSRYRRHGEYENVQIQTLALEVAL